MALRAPATPPAQAAARIRANPPFFGEGKFFVRLTDMFTTAPGLYGWKGMAPSRAGFQTGFGAYFLPGSKWKHTKLPAVFGRTEGDHTFPPFVGIRQIRGELAMKKHIQISAIPELETSVGMHGSVKQQEVKGPLILGLVVAVVIAI